MLAVVAVNMDKEQRINPRHIFAKSAVLVPGLPHDCER